MLSEKLKKELPFYSWVCIKKKKKKNPATNSKRHMYPKIHSSIIYNIHGMEAT